MNMVGHQVPFLDFALLLLRQVAKHPAELPAQLPVDRFLPILRDEHDVVLTLPLRMT